MSHGFLIVLLKFYGQLFKVSPVNRLLCFQEELTLLGFNPLSFIHVSFVSIRLIIDASSPNYIRMVVNVIHHIPSVRLLHCKMFIYCHYIRSASFKLFHRITFRCLYIPFIASCNQRL